MQSGDTVYYVYRNDDADEIGVTARKADGSVEPLFSSDRVPDNLYLGADGAFYFLWWEKLLRYDPAVNKVDEVYACLLYTSTTDRYGQSRTSIVIMPRNLLLCMTFLTNVLIFASSHLYSR